MDNFQWGVSVGAFITSFMLGIAIWVLVPPPDNTRETCMMQNPGYYCAIQTEWVVSKKIGE